MGKSDTPIHRHQFHGKADPGLESHDLIQPRVNRTALAREACSRFQLYQANGKMKVETVCSIFRRMDMDNMISLPPIMQTNHVRGMHGGDTPEQPWKTIELDSNDIRELRLVPVVTRMETELWNNIISRYHYIKSYRLYGPRIRYLVYGKLRTVPPSRNAAADSNGKDNRPLAGVPEEGSPDPICGEYLVAALGFAPGAWRVSCRDAFIGWNDQQRLANLRYVVSNARFLILPWIKCRNLASRILAAAARRLPRDWEDRYHYRPVLLETFVQSDRFTGTCYKAANWIRVGTTKGYSLYGIAQQKQVPNKAVFVYSLTRKFREILCGADI